MDMKLDTRAPGAFYRAVWRLHFMAGLIVLPLLVMMAVTGGAYLFRPEIDHWVYRDLQDVPARAAPQASAGTVVAAVESQLHGRVLQFLPSPQPGRAARLLVRTATGEAVTAFADPYDGRVTGTTPFGGVMQLVRKIHSLQRFGFWASCLVEIAAGWAIVLAASGLFLWWPRGARGGVVSVRGRPAQRVFWRDLHAVTGMGAAAVILFLAVTGMPWSMFWGAHVQQWATQAGINEPEPPPHVTPEWMLGAPRADASHAAHAGHVHAASAAPDMPWAMEKMPAPQVDAPAGASPMDVDAAVAAFRKLGVDPQASITLPDDPRGAYVATWRPDRVEDTRVVYLDPYSGRVLGDVGFKDWGPAGKAIEWGIAVHQGQEYGAANRWLMLAGCAAIVLLAVSAVVMWWKRRPSGAIGLPPAPGRPGAMAAVVGCTVVAGVLFPLVGATLVAAVLLDRLVALLRRHRPSDIRP